LFVRTQDNSYNYIRFQRTITVYFIGYFIEPHVFPFELPNEVAVQAGLTVTAFDTPRRFIKFRVLNGRQRGITRAICLFVPWHDCLCKLARTSIPYPASNSRSNNSGRN